MRLRSGAISEERFVAEMVSLRKAFEKIVGELTLEAKSSALAAMASLKVSESQTTVAPCSLTATSICARASSNVI